MDNAGNESWHALAPFNKVTQRNDRVLIVATGPSAKKLDLNLVTKARSRGVYVLAVNQAWNWLSELDGWFTLDPNEKVNRFIHRESGSVRRYVAVPADYGRRHARIEYHRNIVFNPDITYLFRLSGDGLMGLLSSLSTDPHCIHTGNSAYGALGVARHMGASRVGLIGVDANRSLGYANTAGRPMTTLIHLPALFETALEQLAADDITVQNGSPQSRVTCFVRREPNAVVRWLME